MLRPFSYVYHQIESFDQVLQKSHCSTLGEDTKVVVTLTCLFKVLKLKNLWEYSFNEFRK